MGRMNDALDKKSEEIFDLHTVLNVILGELLDLQDNAKAIRDELTAEGGSVTANTLDEFCKEIDQAEKIIKIITEPEKESDEAKEEEKDD